MKKKWISRAGSTFIKAVAQITDDTAVSLRLIQNAADQDKVDDKIVADLKKRKFVAQKKFLYFTIEKGEQFATTIVKQSTDLTADMLTRCVSADLSTLPDRVQADYCLY